MHKLPLPKGAGGIERRPSKQPIPLSSPEKGEKSVIWKLLLLDLTGPLDLLFRFNLLARPLRPLLGTGHDFLGLL